MNDEIELQEESLESEAAQLAEDSTEEISENIVNNDAQGEASEESLVQTEAEICENQEVIVITVSSGDNMDLSELILLTEENNLLLQNLVELEQTENMTIWEKPLADWTPGDGCLLVLLFVVLFAFVYEFVEDIIRW